MPRIIPLAFAGLLVLAWPAAAAAYRLEPISRVFYPTGSGASRTFVVENTSRERIAIEVSIATLERDVDYRESGRPADELFLVHPSQMIVGPGKRQTIRVKWIGDPAPRSELAFRFIVEELPIELPAHGRARSRAVAGRIRIVTTYRGSLFVRPRGARPQVAVENAVRVRSPDRLAVTLRNRGTAHALLRRCRGWLTASGTTTGVLLHPDKLAPLSHTRILAGGRRRYFVPWPRSMQVGPVTARVSCELAP